MSGYNDYWQGYGQDGQHSGYAEGNGQQQIQSYYDEDGYNARGDGSRRRLNDSRRGFHGQYDHSYGHYDQYDNSHVHQGQYDNSYQHYGQYNNPRGHGHHGHNYNSYGNQGQYDNSDRHYSQYDNPYGHQNENWNQPWGSETYSGDVYYSQDDYVRFTEDRSWVPNSYGLSQNDAHEKPRVPEAEVPPRSPSPSYLTTSLEPSDLADPAPRKLLILDLNGTLLLRSKPPPAPRGQGPYKPVKRVVHTRPYFASFREYLSHPETRKWLDVMIWSSAMPHSVQDMLKHCFPVAEDDQFIAVWARDTLGLSSVDYSRKTQTVKDLRKPWRELAPENGAAHSAHTTLLLDDSPLKAYLQPWNHVCVPEYDDAARAADVQALAGQANMPDAEDTATTPPASTAAQPTTHSAPLDRTLLAVIGILEALRLESNVAGWLRAGGLCTKLSEKKALIDAGDGETAHSPVSHDRESVSDRTTEVAADSEAARSDEKSIEAAALDSPSPSSLKFSHKHTRDLDTDKSLEAATAKRARRTSPPESPNPPERPPFALVETSTPAQRPPFLVPASPPASSLPPPTPLPASSPPPSAPSPRAPESTTDLPVVPSLGAKSSTSSTPPHWFENAPTLTHWIEKGHAALSTRGIAEIAGDGP